MALKKPLIATACAKHTLAHGREIMWLEQRAGLPDVGCLRRMSMAGNANQ
jgi:hypothetical protein